MTNKSLFTRRGRQADRTRQSARRRLPRRPLGAGFAVVAAAALLAACSSGGNTDAASGGAGGGTGTTLSTGQVPSLGTVLTDQSGMTVYEAQQEVPGKIACTGSCLSFWFPVTVAKGAKPHQPAGITGKLSTITRPDTGATQLTVNGHPLYTFRQDSGPSSAMGNDFHDSFGGHSFTWHALTVAGTAAPATGVNSTPTAASSYSY